MWKLSESGLNTSSYRKAWGREDVPPLFSFWRYPLFWVVLSAIFGFLLGECFLPPFFPLFLLFVALIVSQILFFHSRVFFLFFLACWGVFGALLFALGFVLPWEFFREREGERITLEGYLMEQDGRMYLSRLGGFWLYSPTLSLRGSAPSLRPLVYRRVRVSGTFRSFASCANPGGRDLRVHYFRKRVFGYLEVKEIAPLSSRNPWFLFLRWVWEKRRAFLERFAVELGEMYAPLFSAVFLGLKEGNFPERARVFQEMGVYHLFCVSGFHMALLGGTIWLALRRFLPRRVMPWVTLPFTFLYLAFCSFVPSAFRAWIMMSLFFLSRGTGRIVTTMGILLSAFFLMFILQPEIVFAPGVQLSFTSTVGVIVFSWFLERFLRRGGQGWSVILRYFGSVFLVTGGVLLVSFPFLVGNRLTLSSLVFLGNLLLPPLVEGVLFLALLSPLLGVFALGRLALVFCLQRLLSLLLGLSELFGKFVPHVVFDFSVGQNILWGMVAWGVVVLVLLGFSTRKKIFPIMAAFFLLWGVLFGALWFPEESFVVFDVGQGLACGLFDGNSGILIDTGGIIRGYGNVASSILVPSLRSKRVSNLLGIFLTHGHKDHAGGVEHIRVAFPEASLFLPEHFSSFEHLRLFDNVFLEVLSVRDVQGPAAVYRLHTPWGRVLILGDVEDIFLYLAPDNFQLLETDVIVLPHHGSYSKSLRRLLSLSCCRWAIISVGENPYGHPDGRTIEVLEELGIPYFITREDGAIEYYPFMGRGRIRKIGKKKL